MKSSNAFRFIFDNDGIIYFAEAPFYNPASEKKIDEYFPIFSDQTTYDTWVNKPIHPYEFEINDRNYFVDINLDHIKKNGQRYYDLVLVDKSNHYLKFQAERTEKNNYKISNERMLEMNHRLKSKIEQLDEILQYVVGNEVKSPIGSIRSTLQVLDDSKNLNASQTQLIKISIEELSRIENIISAVYELQMFSNSKSFEQTYYCSFNEILEDTKETLISSVDFEIAFDINDQNQYFVNKFHFTKILQSLIKYLASFPLKYVHEVIIKNLKTEDRTCGLLIESKADYLSSNLNTSDSIKSLKSKEQDFNLMIAKKLSKLYGGTVSVNDDNPLATSIKLDFKNLLVKKSIS